MGRYDYLKDIERLETYCRLEKDWHGISIFLTNDATYWKNPISTMTVDSYFRIHESRSIQGSLAWGENAKLGTIKTREKIITLMGSYTMQWFDYSDLATGRNSKFRFLLHEVNPSGAGEKSEGD